MNPKTTKPEAKSGFYLALLISTEDGKRGNISRIVDYAPMTEPEDEWARLRSEHNDENHHLVDIAVMPDDGDPTDVEEASKAILDCAIAGAKGMSRAISRMVTQAAQAKKREAA